MKLISKLLSINLIVILISVIAAMFTFSELREICVCISNYLAWGWIAFGLSAILSLITIFLISTDKINPKVESFLILIITLLMSTGIVLLILFGARLLDVI